MVAEHACRRFVHLRSGPESEPGVLRRYVFYGPLEFGQQEQEQEPTGRMMMVFISICAHANTHMRICCVSSLCVGNVDDTGSLVSPG